MPSLDQYTILTHLTDCALIIDQDDTFSFANQPFSALCSTTIEKTGDACKVQYTVADDRSSRYERESGERYIEIFTSPVKNSGEEIIPPLEEKSSTLGRPTKEGTCLTGTERILVVDDDPLLVSISQRILEDYGYTVTGTTDSREALEKVRAEPQQFDLLITDQTMPGLSGSELAWAVLNIVPDMPIIICTGHSAVISAQEAMAMGIRKFLYKPIHADELARTVKIVLDEARKPQWD